jgi:RND family efflux transporter MFP subunit
MQPGEHDWVRRGRGLVRDGVPLLRGTIPSWVLKWAISLLLILLLFKGYHMAVGMLQAPELQLKQAMFPSGLSGPVAVTVQAATKQTLVRSVTYPGTVAPDEEIPVAARVQGWVLDIGPREGDTVRAGQVLARLDTTQLTPQVQQQASSVAAAQAAYDQQQIAISVAESNYERQKIAVAQAKASLADAQAQESYWAGEFARDRALYQAGAISASEFDQAKAAYASAQARVAAIREQIAEQETAAEVARRQIAEQVQMAHAAAAQVRAQQARLGQVQTTLGYATIVAPQDGIVSARLVDPGALVQPGQPLLKIARMRSVRVRVQVAQEDAPAVRVGTPAVIEFSGLAGRIAAHVTRVFPAADPHIRTVTAEMLIPNPGERIKLDTYASVTLQLAVHPDVVVVPRSAVVPLEGRPTVFVVVNGNTAHAQPVTTGMESGGLVEITHGLAPGAMVVTDGNRELSDGQSVTVTTSR